MVDDVIVDPRGCLRGMSMNHMIYGPDRVKKPLIRVGERGEGKWRAASRDEALTTSPRR